MAKTKADSKPDSKASPPATAKTPNYPAPKAASAADDASWLAQTIKVVEAASPEIYQPGDGAPIPTGQPVLVLISTNRTDLGYRVSLFDVTILPPVLVTFIDTPPPGQTHFGVEFAAAFFQPNHQYAIRVEVIPGTPGFHNTDQITVLAEATVAVYRAPPGGNG